MVSAAWASLGEIRRMQRTVSRLGHEEPPLSSKDVLELSEPRVAREVRRTSSQRWSTSDTEVAAAISSIIRSNGVRTSHGSFAGML
jgi:hypothetical protein